MSVVTRPMHVVLMRSVSSEESAVHENINRCGSGEFCEGGPFFLALVIIFYREKRGPPVMARFSREGVLNPCLGPRMTKKARTTTSLMGANSPSRIIFFNKNDHFAGFHHLAMFGFITISSPDGLEHFCFQRLG